MACPECGTMDLNYTLEDRENIRIVHISGTVSSLNSRELGLLVDDITQKSNIIIDMAKAGVVTSSGINALMEVSVSAKNRGKRVLLLNMRPELVKTIEQLDLYEYFIFIQSFEEGKMKLRFYT